jgi:hypothetical protein
VTAFFRRAEEILRIATNDDSELGDTLVVLDRQGGFRMLDPTGWSLPALAAEFGAEAVYKVERRGLSVRVEGWDGSQRCLFQGQTGRDRARSLLGAPFAPQAKMLPFPALALA